MIVYANNIYTIQMISIIIKNILFSIFHYSKTKINFLYDKFTGRNFCSGICLFFK